MIEPISVVRNNKRRKVAGSQNTSMPTKAVPTAPMPVHTAYAVPMGSVCVAFIKSAMLMMSAKANPPYQRYISEPVVSFALPKQKAKATSNSPAMTNVIQFIFTLFYWACNLSIFSKIEYALLIDFTFLTEMERRPFCSFSLQLCGLLAMYASTDPNSSL